MSDSTLPANTRTNESTIEQTKFRLRLWPGVLLIAALWGIRVWASVGEGAPFKFFFGLIIAPVAIAVALQLWWLFASRIRWSERLIGTIVFVIVAEATRRIAGKNFPPMALIMFALPAISTLWIAWLIVSYRLPWSVRRSGVLFAFIATGLVCTLLRVNGMDGSFRTAFHWRWTPTPEDKLLSELKSVPTTSQPGDSPTDNELALQEGDWPCFRGPHQDSRLTGVRIQSDWEKNPPKELWRHRVGPGWSSCSVVGDRLFTQEQRGEEEYVVCYDSETGSEVWSHRDPVAI